jgi:ferredoxin
MAQYLSQAMEDCNIMQLTDVMEGKRDFTVPEKLGFVFPTYVEMPPEIIIRFIREQLATQDLSPLGYLYIVTDGGARHPTYCHKAIEAELSKAGAYASYYGYVSMPDNYLRIKGKATNSKTIAKADKKLKIIADEIKNEKLKPPAFRPLPRLFINLFGSLASRFNVASHFTVTDQCTGCGRCYRSCPAGNISMQDGKPTFLQGCQNCFGCISYCPAKAILYKGKERTARYTFPDGPFYIEYRK